MPKIHVVAEIQYATEVWQTSYDGGIIPREKRTQFCTVFPVTCSSVDRDLDRDIDLGSILMRENSQREARPEMPRAPLAHREKQARQDQSGRDVGRDCQAGTGACPGTPTGVICRRATQSPNVHSSQS
jgi:hypothetical protein